MTQTDEAMPEVIYVNGHNAYKPDDVWSFHGHYTLYAKDANLPRYVRADKLTPPAGLREAIAACRKTYADTMVNKTEAVLAFGSHEKYADAVLKAAEMVLGLEEK